MPMSGDTKKLRNWLYEQVDGLKDAYCEQKDYLKTAFLLRDWVGKNATFSHKELLLDHRKLDFWQLLRGALELRGGLWCGGVARLLFGIADCFPGLYIAEYGYGMHGEQNITHVTNLVALKDGSVYNLDAYLGYQWRDAGDGALLDFGGMLSRIKRKQYDSIVREDVVLPRPAVAMIGDDGRNFNWMFQNGLPEPKEHNGVQVFYGAIPSYEALYREGSHNRLRIDSVRGDKPLGEFMLDLMLVEPSFSRFTGKDMESTEYKAFREILYKVM